MRKQLKQIKVWLSKKRVLLFVLIFSIAMPGISIFFLAQKSNLPYLALLIFIVPYLGILFFLLKAIDRTQKISEQLRIQKENYRVTLSSLGEGLITTNNQGQIVYMNPAAEKLTGWSWQDAKKRSLQNVFNVANEETGKPFENIVNRILKEGKGIEWENNTILSAKDSGTFIISNNGSPLLDSNGRITGAVLVFNDITEKKKNEKELKENEKQYSDLIQNLPEAVYTCDERGYIKIYNKAAVKLWGREPEAGKDLWCGTWKIFNTDGTDLPLDSCPMAICLKEGMPVHGKEIMVQRPDGSLRHVLPYPSPIFNSEGELTGAVNMLIDITDKKEREILIKRSEEKYRSIIEQASDAILIYSFDGTIHEFNKSSYTLLGYLRNEYAKLKLNDILVDDIIVNQSNYAAILAGETKTIYRNLKHKNGSFIETEVTVKLLADGKAIAFARDISERKKAEEELRASEEIRKLIMDSALDAIISMDTAGFITAWTPQAEKIFGWKAKEVIGKSVSEIIIPAKYRKQHSAGIQQYLKTGEGQFINRLVEVTALNKEGREFPVELLITPIKQGETEFFCSFIRDITERKKAEETIKKEKELLESVINSLPGVFYFYDENLKLLRWNKQLENVTGYLPAELSNMNPADFFEGEDRTHMQERSRDVFVRGSGNAEACFTAKDGKKVPFYFTGLRMQYEGRPSLLGIGIDITERKKIEEKIKKSNERFELIGRATNDAIWEWNLETNELWGNEMHQQLYGLTLADAVPNDEEWKQRLHAEDRERIVKSVEESLASESNIWDGEYRLNTVNKGWIYTFGQTYIVRNNEGKPVRMIGSMMDITERKKTEEEILEINKQLRLLSGHLQKVREEERTHMAREIHDELGQQLTVMKMDVSWLYEKLGNASETVRQRTNELRNMLDKTVTTVRRIASELRPSMLDDMGLAAAIEWHLSEFGKRFGIKTEFDKKETELLLPDAVKTGLFRIVQESLTNVARYAKAKKVTVNLQQKEGQVLLIIKDDGAGFEMEEIAAKKTLGILGMKERTAMMGGTYNINSTPGKGTMVAVKIPFEG